MKALLLLTALMVSALPVKADDTRFLNRSTVVGALAGTDCFVRKGKMTEEEAKEVINYMLSVYPELNAAYSWALSSDKASKAVQVILPYLNSDCNKMSLSEDEAQRLIGPYLN
tara:strand:+ start:194 stop:532 length:339 start_codon:yes stop_codon:yes gene_type:complete